MNLPAMLLALISTTIFFSGCSKKEKVETAEPVKVLTIDKIEKRNGMYYEVNQPTPFTGLLQELYPDGQRKREMNIKDGLKQGIETEWHENGQKSSDMNYKDGLKQDVETRWRKDGTKMSVLNLKDGKKHGVYNKWHENGKKSEEVTYKDGKKEGLVTTWHDNGKKSAETNYKGGEIHGVHTSWHKNGTKVLEMNIKDGLKQDVETRWRKDGTKMSELNLKDGKKHGVYSKWHENGKKSSEQNFKGGWECGILTNWHKNGQKSEEVTYKDGKKEGLVTTWHDNGKKSAETNYKGGKKVGQWTKWDKNGVKVGEGTNEVVRVRRPIPLPLGKFTPGERIDLTTPPSRRPRVRTIPTPPSRAKATPVLPPRRAPRKTLMKRRSGLQFQKSRALATGSAPAKITTHTVVDESSIVNTGAALVSAVNFGEVEVTVNSLLHGSETGAGKNLTLNSRFEGALRHNPLPAPLDTLFRGIAGAPSLNLDISGLEIGTEYLFQAYWEDNAGQIMNVTMEGDTLSGIADQPNGLVISYTFTAGDNTLNTSFTRRDRLDNTWLSGYSLQKVTPTNPKLAAATPPDNALETLNTANLVSTFDMMVKPGTGNISIHKSDHTLVEVIDVNDTTAPGTITFSGTNVTINPTAPLEDGVGYYVLIDNTAITNVLGSPFAGITDKTGWNFTAKSLDGLSGELGVLDLSANNGINPATGKLWKAGDTYRFLFITSQATNAESADIATYNKFVQRVANDSSLNLDGATWKTVGSTAAVDARTNTTTDPAVNGTGEAFFLLDGSTVLATNYTDLWDGLAATPNIDEHAQPSVQIRPFTGSFTDGTAKVGDLELGGRNTKAGTGINDQLGTIWLNSFNDPRTDLRPLFAMSNPLKIVGGSTSENHGTPAE
jgi:antitoxin component YwqK of YwqJK toxin-antitoxin module